MKKMTEAQKLEAIVRLLGAAEIRMERGGNIGLAMSLLFGVSTARTLRSWYWHPLWLEIEGKDFQQMWTTSDRGDWLLWFCSHMIGQPGWPSQQQVVLASCQCARLSLKFIKPTERRPLKAIETAEAWARGEATLEQVKRAGHAANCVTGEGDLAYLAACAAHSAARAVYATEDGRCFRLAQAASAGASRAADATGCCHDLADRKRVENATLRQCAELVRESLNVPDYLASEISAFQLRKTRGFCKEPSTDTFDSTDLWLKGQKSLERGKELYFQNEFQLALKCFDSAVESGFQDENVYFMRGGCLQSLQFDLDAIDDFTKATEIDPEDSNYYFMRSISKGAIGDTQGRMEDLNEAVRLACIDSVSTRSHNAYARENGYKEGVADMYRMQIVLANIDLERCLQDPEACLDSGLVVKRQSQARRRKLE